jgi:hypothetical protein
VAAAAAAAAASVAVAGSGDASVYVGDNIMMQCCNGMSEVEEGGNMGVMQWHTSSPKRD